MRTLDRAVKDRTLHEDRAAKVERLLDVGAPSARSWAAQWAAAAGDPAYLSAFDKLLRDPAYGHHSFSERETEAVRTAAEVQHTRAMSLTDSSGGFLVPMQLDPAILLSSSGSANPLRQMCRVVQVIGDVWSGISSDGVVSHWYAEAAEASDDSPTLNQPTIPNYRGSAFVPFSVEIEGDGADFVNEVSRLLIDSIDQLQATAFVTGSGSNQPTGFVTALSGTASVVDGGATLDAADAYALQDDLPPRFQQNSAFAANLTSINVLRQAETSNGALKFPSLQDDPPMLCGRRMWEVSNMSSVDYVAALGDWSQFVICDRVGSTIELIPHLFGSNRRPTGQRGFFAWFRTGADVVVDNAFRVLLLGEES